LDSVGDARVVVATAVKGWCRRGDFPSERGTGGKRDHDSGRRGYGG